MAQALTKKTTMKRIKVSSVIQVYKVQVTLQNDEVYDVFFRKETATNTIKQEQVFQMQWDEALWTTIPKLVPYSKMYLNTTTRELELYEDVLPHRIPQACTILTYAMFDDKGVLCAQ